MSGKLFTVAWWEYSEKISSKAFLVSLILIPAVMIALVVVPALFIRGSDGSRGTIGVVDGSGVYAGTFIGTFSGGPGAGDAPGAEHAVDLGTAAGGDPSLGRALGDSLVMAGFLEGYLVVNSPGGDIVDVEFRTANIGNIRLQERVATAMKEAVTAVKLRRLGMDPAAFADISRSVHIRTMKVAGGGTVQETGFEETFFSVYVYMMMLFFLILTSGQLLVRSMLEEKSNRIVELLLSSVSARDLMGGKIIGLGALGLTQMVCWGTFVFIVGHFAGMTGLPPAHALLLLVYFILGYMLYTAIFVAAGAPVSTEQEAQQITSLLSFGLIIPLALSFHVMQDPQSTVSVALSMIPVFTPMMMAIRIPVEMPAVTEIAASMVLLGGSAYMMMNVAGRVFSASVLLRGRRLTLREAAGLLKNF